MDDDTSTPVTRHIASAFIWEGNLGDIYPPDEGSQQAKDVTDAPESAGIPCFSRCSGVEILRCRKNIRGKSLSILFSF
jgi:hypothetical protein